MITPYLLAYSQDSSQPIEIWYGRQQVFGNVGTPQPMINIIGQVANHQDLYTLSYNFQRVRDPLPTGPTAFRLVEPGEFNIEIDRTKLATGEYDLEIIAAYKNGEIFREPVTFRLEDKTGSLPVHIDWSEVKNIQDVAQVVDGKWTITDSGLRTMSIGYDRAVAIGDASWKDYEFASEFTIHSVTDDPNAFGWPSVGIAMHIAVRWQGHEDWGDLFPRRGWSGFGALFSYYQRDNPEKMVWIYDQIERKPLITRSPYVPIETNKEYIMQAQVYSRPGKTSIYRMKLWIKGETEPADWELEAEGRPGEPEKGSILLVAHQADISFKNITIKKLTIN
jgi:hypothetical protein